MNRLPADNLERRLELACVLEATARKAGNVHPGASFRDSTYRQFVDSARIAAPILANAAQGGIGAAVYQSVDEVRRQVGSNTNLGILLLLAPLAGTAATGELTPLRVQQTIDRLDQRDGELIYAAIRLASPGGLGSAPEQDVALGPTIPLREAMALAADRDLIARQYADGFREVFGTGLEAFVRWAERTNHWELSILGTQLSLMSEFPETLILRKCGVQVAKESAVRARRVIDRGWPNSSLGRSEFADFDQWLRADGHRRNPGTTADLIAAILFVLLETSRWPWTLPWIPPDWSDVLIEAGKGA